MTSRVKWIAVMVGAVAVAVVVALVGGRAERAAAGPELEPAPIAPSFAVAGGAAGKLKVAAAHPKGPTEGEARPTITFDRPVAPMATVEELRRLPAAAAIEPKVPGEWRWLGSSTLEFVPATRLPRATAFRVKVPAGLKAIDGAALDGDFEFGFETSRPRVDGVAPRDGWRWVERRQKFELTFSQPVVGLEGGVRLEAGGAQVPVKVGKAIRVVEEELAAAGKSARKWIEARMATDLRTRYEVTPERDLPGGTAVLLTLADTIHGAAGPLTLAGTRSWRYQAYGPMEIAGARACWRRGWRSESCPHGPLVLTTSNTPSARELKQLLTIEPAVAIDWAGAEGNEANHWDTSSSPTLVIPGRFRPGTRYTIKLAAGLLDQFGQRAPAWQGEFETTDLEAEYDLGTAGQRSLHLLEAAGDGALPLRTSNVAALELRFWKLTPSSAAALAVANPTERAAPGAPVTQTFRTGAGKNTVKTQPLSVRSLLGGARTGLYLLEARDPDGSKKPTSVLGQLTDLAVHAKLGVTSGAVWVTRVSDGTPVAGAEVALHDQGGGVAWRGTTGPDGLVRAAALGAFAGVAGYWWDSSAAGQRVVSATKDGDTGLAVASWGHALYPGAFGVEADASGGKPLDLGLLMAERGIYRPGEKVYLKGYLRYRAMGEIRTPPAGSAVKLKLVNSRDGVALQKQLVLSRFGTFDAEFDVPEDAPLGTWTASAIATVGDDNVRVAGAFRVEAYRAPQFRVDVSAPAAHLAAGDPVKAQVLARYLFGAALSEAPVRWTVARKTLEFRPPRHDGFDFGIQTWWWDDGEPSPSGDVFATGRGKTDALGGLAIDAGKAEASADRTWAYEVEAEVEDLSRQTVADRAQVIVHPASVYAGVHRAPGFAEAGKPLTFELVAVTPTGERREATVAVELRRREWKWIKKKVAGDRWTTVSEAVEEPAGTCSARPGTASATCSITPAKPGFHVVQASLKDEQGRAQVTRTALYVIGEGWVAWQRDDTDRIDLVPDKASYEVGQVARILVKSPYPSAEALLTVEREGVLTARRVRLEGAAAVLDVPIGEEAVPNVFVGLVITRGRQAGQAPTTSDDPGRPAVKLGYAQLKVEKRGKRLAVKVTPDAAEHRPRDTVKLDVEVKDAAGRGAAAEVMVWAVDEAVLRLTGFELPDLVEAIHPPRGLAVRAGEPLLGLVLRQLYAEKGANPGGGGGGSDGVAMRTRFRTTPLFAPAVLTDAAGRAHVEFKLPDNLTTFRIMAVAVTDKDRAGGGESSVVVAQPLLALPALPRAAHVGDRFEAGVVVHSPGNKIDKVEVSVEAQGLKLEGPAMQQVALPGGKPKEIRFRFLAERAGQAVLRFKVSGGGEKDGLEQRFPVTLPIPLEAVALQGETGATAHEQLLVPKGVRADTGGLELTLASSALGGFAEGMTQLVDYPYGCLEQLSSRLVPFVALRELASQGMISKADWLLPPAGQAAPGAITAGTPDEVVKKTIQAIESRQRPDGGYRFWDGDQCVSPFASAYAVWSLGRAGKAGYRVDQAALERGRSWLETTVLAGRCIQCYGSCEPAGDTSRVFALFALARTGQARGSYHSDLYSRRKRLPLFSQAMLADALAHGGDRGRAGTLLDELLDAAKVTTAEVHLEEPAATVWDAPWSSDTRSTAMALQATLAIRPDHPYVTRMVTHLARARRPDGRFRNTQEAAFSLSALSDLVRVREAATPDFNGRVTLGGKPVAAMPFRGRSLEVRKVLVTMSELLAGRKPSEALPLDFQRDGPAGTLYYGAVLRSAPAEPSAQPLERGLFVQRWLEPWEGGGQLKATKAGEVVRLRVRVSSPQQRNFVAVEIPLPSGLEAVDTTLQSTARRPAPAETGDDGEQDEDRAATERDWTFWTPFNHVELRDDRVLLFSDWLPAGVHTYSLPVRATTPGQFLLAPAHGGEMYAPEVFGRSDGGTFSISLPDGPGR